MRTCSDVSGGAYETELLNRYSHFRDTPICSFFGRIAGFGQCAPHEYEWRFTQTEHFSRCHQIPSDFSAE